MAKQIQQPLIFWGLSVEKWREISALIFSLFALLLFLSLLSNDTGSQWMGTIGSNVAFGLRFVMGRVVSYVLPALFVLAAVHAFHGRTPFHPLRKTIAGFLILISLCALLTLRYSLHDDIDSRTAAFLAGGVLGNFFTSGDGLGMADRCGPVGSLLICLAALLTGAMLSTDFLFMPIVQRIVWGFRSLIAWFRRPKPVATLRFDRPG